MDLHVSLVGRTHLGREIYAQIRQAIVSGQLRPGEALPPTRELAARLHVARRTVAVVYDRLSAEGYVTSKVGAGTFVSSQLPRPRRPSSAAQSRAPSALEARPHWDAIPLPAAFNHPVAKFDFRCGVPDSVLFPHKTWRTLTARAMRSQVGTRIVYGHPGGHLPLRTAIARHIALSRSVTTAPDDVTITNGTQQALDVIARTLLAPGQTIALEEPCYPPARWLFESLGARIVSIPVDENGLVVDLLPRDTRCVYVTPSHQYPLGVAMSLSRRHALLDWAEQHGAAIIEDDYDSEFRFSDRPLEPLHTLDTTGRVVYVGSFSKTLLPSLRLGFIVTPPSLTPAVQRAKYVTDWETAMLPQMVLAEFLEMGGFARHIRRMRGEYQARHALITQALTNELSPFLELIPSSAGLHVAATAREYSVERISAVAQLASNRGVGVHELAKVSVANPPRAGLVLGYGAIATARVPAGLSRLLACFQDA